LKELFNKAVLHCQPKTVHVANARRRPRRLPRFSYRVNKKSGKDAENDYSQPFEKSHRNSRWIGSRQEARTGFDA
jgi:hypothetical protein